ncbi:hypothetical protein G647_01273 [Cladophialophora carrionii CBS 160.54]|uniref:Uncharacterized protein n=1 Tax=Cladophialophora carrionii CBS 160.54 TaxID=1279043 RepID=V9DQ90_9EURO|nr:uncharacterized protein G647_01273 [Cladophialophora carrionii CBS 160.54]ETI28821.1 hypothetical protein G647_01273 [Cladophialophora carrionii CBS 160.54]
MAPIAAILCGREPKMAQAMIKILAPKIEVVHVCTSRDTAVSEIPALLRGETTAPSSGLGANAEGSARSDVSLIIIGGGYPKDDVQAIKEAADAVKPLPLFCADVSKTAGSGPPPPDMIKKRIIDSIEKEEKGEGEWAPGVYMY